MILSSLESIGSWHLAEQTLEKETQATRGIPLRFLVFGSIIVVAVVYLVWSATQSAAVYYFTVSEVLSDPASVQGRGIRIQGRVADGSIEQDSTRLWIHFDLTDGIESIRVEYEHTPPDLLGYSTEERYQDVIVEGRLDRVGVMQARNLLVQHGADFQTVDSLTPDPD